MKFVVIEMDPTARDNRPLGKSGLLLTGTYGESDIAEFRDPDAARDAASRAPNRRPGYELFVPGARKVAA